MEPSDSLRKQIEACIVELNGQRYPLRFESVKQLPPPDAHTVEVTAATTVAGQIHRATVGVGIDRLDGEEDYIASALTGAMRAVLTGELPPGRRQML